MSVHEKFIREALRYARLKNPIWPFAAVIVDEHDKILVRVAECAHISPLYHAESLAIHALLSKFGHDSFRALTLYTTGEPDVLSQSAIYPTCRKTPSFMTRI